MNTRSLERYKPGVRGEVRTGLLQRGTRPPVMVKYEVIDGLAIFEGDIVLGCADDLDSSKQRAIIIPGDGFRWHNGVIPFDKASDLPASVATAVDEAIQHWQDKTSIRFVHHTVETHFVRFIRGDGCSSPTGRRDNDHDITLADDCDKASVIHEIGHTVGLWHEQSREDRDKYVKINTENLNPTLAFNFDQHITDGDDVGPYDYDSIMHYPDLFILDPDFVKDRAIPGIIAPQPIGQREGLSAGDIAGVRFMYYFQRRGDSGNMGPIVSEIAAIRHRTIQNLTQQVLTAVRNADGRLMLNTWQVHPNGSVTPLHEKLAGHAADIDITRDVEFGGRYVSVCRLNTGKFKLISWKVGEEGQISRLGNSEDRPGGASLISIVAMGRGLFVTALRNGAGNLLLITWRLNDDNSITFLQDSGSAAGEVSEISVTRQSFADASGKPGRLVTSVRDGDGDLKLIVWDIFLDGAIERRGDSADQAGEATLIRSVESNGFIITSVRAGNDKVKLISWGISEDGLFVSRLADTEDQGDEIQDNALMRRGLGVISAIRASNKNLKLIAWDVSRSGWIQRAGDSYDLAHEASLINICADSLDGTAPMVTAVQIKEGNLKLITWNDET